MDIFDFADGIKKALIYWRDTHSTPDGFMELQLCDMNPLDWYQTVVLKGHADKEWHEMMYDAILRSYANVQILDYCPEHGICDYGCDQCDNEPDQATPEQKIEYFTDIGFEPDEYDVIRALKTTAFNTFQRDWGAAINPQVDEINECLAGWDADPVGSLAYAVHINHVNGVIAKDYSSQFGVDYDTVNAVSELGLLEVFGQDALDEYLTNF